MDAERSELARIAPEAGLLLGAGRAIVLQMAHPQIGRAIDLHSNFTANPVSRLLHTLGYLYALSNGTERQRQRILAHVNAAHAPVRGPRDRATGAPAYSALDPRLQLWVAATLYDSSRVLAAQILPRWGELDTERLYQHNAIWGRALQMPAGLWPRNRADFDDYYTRTLEELRVDDTVRRLADELFTGRQAPWWARAVLPLVRDVTIAQLPASVREKFGYELTDRVIRRNRAAVATARVATRVLPGPLRRLPMRLVLARVSRLPLP